MKLEDIDDVLKQNVSKDCCVRWLAALILHSDDYSKLYECCRNYDEFEERVLNKECCLNDIYSAISMYGKDRRNHWYRIRELFGDRCFKTASDVGSLLVGNEEFQVLIPNGYGDGTTRVAVFNKADSDGNYKVGTYETPDEKRPDGQYSNTYEGSYIDNYLENTWYRQLPEKLQKAIQATDIKQAAYNNTSSNPKWRYFDPNGGSSYDWYYNEGTTDNPKWVIYYKANIPDDAQGAYPLNCWKYSEKGYNNTTYNTISRHVFLPSVEEVSNLVDLNNANKVYNFLKGTNNSVYHMWFRDSNSSSPRNALHLVYHHRSMYYGNVTGTWIGVRPAFTVDLSTVSVSVVDSVNYK